MSIPQARTFKASLRPLLPVGILLFLSALWGATFTLSKVAIAEGVPPLGYALWQVVGAGLVILIVTLVRHEPVALTREHIRFYGVTGLLGVAAPISAMYLTIGHVPAGVMAIVSASVPLFTYSLTRIFCIEPLNRRRVLGIAIGFAGVLLILLPRTSVPSSGTAFWVAAAFLMPFFYAVGTTYTGHRRPANTSAMPLTLGMLVFAAAGLFPVAILSESVYLPQESFGVAEFAIVGQIVIASLGYLLFFELIRIAGPVYFSQVGYLVTVSGLAYAMWLLDERYSAWVWIGAAVLLVGVALVARNPRSVAKVSRASSILYKGVDRATDKRVGASQPRVNNSNRAKETG